MHAYDYQVCKYNGLNTYLYMYVCTCKCTIMSVTLQECYLVQAKGSAGAYTSGTCKSGINNCVCRAKALDSGSSAMRLTVDFVHSFMQWNSIYRKS